MKSNIIYQQRYKAIIARLVKARKEVGLSQEELANKLGIKQPELSRIEICQRRIDVVELLDWIRATGAEDLKCVITALEGSNA